MKNVYQIEQYIIIVIFLTQPKTIMQPWSRLVLFNQKVAAYVSDDACQDNSLMELISAWFELSVQTTQYNFCFIKMQTLHAKAKLHCDQIPSFSERIVACVCVPVLCWDYSNFATCYHYLHLRRDAYVTASVLCRCCCYCCCEAGSLSINVRAVVRFPAQHAA